MQEESKKPKTKRQIPKRISEEESEKSKNPDIDAVKETSKVSSARRKEEIRQKVHELVIDNLKPSFSFVLSIIGIAIFIRFVHLILPACCGWMDESQLNFIDKVLAFIFGGVVVKYFSDIFPEKPS